MNLTESAALLLEASSRKLGFTPEEQERFIRAAEFYAADDCCRVIKGIHMREALNQLVEWQGEFMTHSDMMQLRTTTQGGD